MPLTRVTITGADNDTDIDRMVGLSLLYPHVEWAVLINNRTATTLGGSPRWPGRAWVDELVSMARRENLQLAMHLCGEPVRQLLRGELDWSGLTSLALVAQRVQINTHAEPHVSTTGILSSLRDGTEMTRNDVKREFIFQWDGVNNHLVYMPQHHGLNVSILFDASHGAGILPLDWPMGMDVLPGGAQGGDDLSWGYAGGLGPDNVIEQLRRIDDEFSDGYDYWIDMETRVRTDDGKHLDMNAVERVLEMTAPLIGK